MPKSRPVTAGSQPGHSRGTDRRVPTPVALHLLLSGGHRFLLTYFQIANCDPLVVPRLPHHRDESQGAGHTRHIHLEPVNGSDLEKRLLQL